MLLNWKDEFPEENRYYETENGILYKGDCLEIMKKFPKESIDLVVTSPPYDNLRHYFANSEEELKKIWNFEKFKKVAKESYRMISNGGVVVWIVGDATIKGSETGTSFKQAIYFKDECGFNLHDTMIYEKAGYCHPSRNRYEQIFEYMFIFSKGKLKTFHPIRDKKNKYAGQMAWGKSTHRNKNGVLVERKRNIISEYSMRYNIWKYNVGSNQSTKDKVAFQHPAIFPELLAHDHIVSWSNEENIILDPLCGSGTTLKMAKKLNRRWIGIEIEEEYCEIAKRRLEESTRQTVMEGV